MQQEQALTVSQLNRQVRTWLEVDIGEVSVMGELSNLSKPGSGHFYFTLKDPGAQLRCVYFRNHHRSNNKQFLDGQQVLAKGRLSLYEARGDYQLIVHSLSEAGLGELYLQFEQLKVKLQAQGLFEQARKKSLPRFPTIIGIITSANGAALHDILTTLQRRYPLAAIKIYASEVQGKNAAQQLIKAIQRANADNHVEVIILARGGGSIEDLWAFNDELLAMTICNSMLPIVSGVGHETDFTIADFVADLRAATPTAAAEAVTPNQLDLRIFIKALEKRLLTAMSHAVQHKQFLLTQQLLRILSPEQVIAKHWQTLDYLEKQLHQCMKNLLQRKQNYLQIKSSHLQAKNPCLLMQHHKTLLRHFEQQLIHAILLKFNQLKHEFTSQLATLHAVSPLATLNRGYAIATFNKAILFSSQQVKTGNIIKVQLAKGKLSCKVLSHVD